MMMMNNCRLLRRPLAETRSCDAAGVNLIGNKSTAEHARTHLRKRRRIAALYSVMTRAPGWLSLRDVVVTVTTTDRCGRRLRWTEMSSYVVPVERHLQRS